MTMPPSTHSSRPAGAKRTPARVRLDYLVQVDLDAWELPEVPVPESVPHHRVVQYLEALLTAWALRRDKDVLVAHNLAVRWHESRPKVGIDPDLCVIDPAPPNAEQLESLCLWKPGHPCPALAIEVVSNNHPYKDYDCIQDKYADLGVPELWVLDPAAFEAEEKGRRVALRRWQTKGDTFELTYAGSGPVHSAHLDGWFNVAGELMLSNDEQGSQRWLTPQEAERVARESAEAELSALKREFERLKQENERG